MENEGPPDWRAPLGGSLDTERPGRRPQDRERESLGEISKAGWPAACVQIIRLGGIEKEEELQLKMKKNGEINMPP